MPKLRIKPASLKNFLDSCTEFAAGIKVSMRDALLEQAAYVCQDAAKFTPPMPKGGGKGLSAAAHRAGMQAVEGDIRKIFVAANDRKKSATSLVTNELALAAKTDDFAAFQSLISGGKIAGLQDLNPIVYKFAIDANPQRAFAKAKNFFNRSSVRRTEYGTQAIVTDLRPVHNQVKGKYGGRIKQGQRVGVTKHLVQDKNQLNEYIVRRQRMVGAVKSGWAVALRSLPLPINLNGQDGPPGADLRSASWVNGHVSVGGYSTSSFGDKRSKVTVANLLGNVNGIADEANTLNLVYGNRIKQMPSQVRYRTQKPINRFNSR